MALLLALHKFTFPPKQNLQFPQPTSVVIATLSPTFIFFIFSPSSSTIPAISCPVMWGGVIALWPFLYILTSVPHMAHAFTLTSISFP